MASYNDVSGSDLTPSLHVQLGTTMSLTASRPQLHQPENPCLKHTYNQEAAFAVPISTSNTINITVPNSPPSPQPPCLLSPAAGSDRENLYATIVPVQPPSPKPDYTSRVIVEPSPTPPPTKPKPRGHHTRSNQSSTGSVASSGRGSIPSSPRMVACTTSSRMVDGEADIESFTWSSLDDTRSERSFNSSGGGSSGEGVECDSACSVGSPDVERDDVVTFDRVGLVSDDKLAVIVQVACESDEGTNHERFIDLIVRITNTIAQYFRKKEAMEETMNATQIKQLVMSDRRPVKDHIKEVCQVIGETVTITKADCRRVNSKGHIGTYVMRNVTYRDKAVVAKTGVIVVLKKLNKFACTKEFAEQVSLHILAARPEELGKKETTTTVERLGKKNPQYAKALLTQRFYCDQTCNVYEAARRSFVEITDFVLYG